MFQEQQNRMSKKKRRLWLIKPKRVMKTRRKYSLLNNTSVHCTCNTCNNSEMRYSETSKLFWKTGYRLFQPKFLYFMGGPKNIGQISDGVDDSGMLRPEKAQINFAVPSIHRLSEFNTSNAVFDKTVPPGVLYPVIEALKTSSYFKDNKYMLCADAKKVTAGIDTEGDVGMFGHKRNKKLTERKERLFNDIEEIDEKKPV